MAPNGESAHHDTDEAAHRRAKVTETIRFWYRSLMKRSRAGSNSLSRSEVVRSLLPTMEGLTAEDFGVPAPPVQDPLDNFPEQPPSQLTYLHVFHCSEFSAGIFFVPQGHEIPFHDHPSMTVASRLLYGQLHSLSLDWLEMPDRVVDEESGASFLTGPAVITENDMAEHLSTLSPNEGNIHRLRALTDSAFLDILSPPYDPRYDRECRYYEVIDDGREVGAPGDVVQLRQVPEPDGYSCLPSNLPVPHNIPATMMVQAQNTHA